MCYCLLHCNANNNNTDRYLLGSASNRRGHLEASCIIAINTKYRIIDLQRYINNIFQISAACAMLLQGKLLGMRNALKISIIFYYLCKCFEDGL